MKAQQHTVETCPPHSVACVTVLCAMRLALKFTTRTPSAKQLMADYGMSKATAYRWIAALKIAKGEA